MTFEQYLNEEEHAAKQLVCVHPGKIEISQGSEAHSAEVKEGDVFTVTREDDYWYFGKLKLAGGMGFEHRPGLSGKKFSPHAIEHSGVIFAINKKQISEKEDDFWASWKEVKTTNESFIVEGNPVKEILRYHIERSVGRSPLSDNDILNLDIGNDMNMNRLIKKFRMLVEAAEPALFSYEFSINKKERVPEVQVFSGGSVKQTATNLVDYINRHPDELDNILSGLSMGMKNFDASVFEKDKTERMKYLIKLVNSKFPDMTMPYDLQVRSGTTKVNPER